VAFFDEAWTRFGMRLTPDEKAVGAGGARRDVSGSDQDPVPPHFPSPAVANRCKILKSNMWISDFLRFDFTASAVASDRVKEPIATAAAGLLIHIDHCPAQILGTLGFWETEMQAGKLTQEGLCLCGLAPLKLLCLVNLGFAEEALRLLVNYAIAHVKKFCDHGERTAAADLSYLCNLIFKVGSDPIFAEPQRAKGWSAALDDLTMLRRTYEFPGCGGRSENSMARSCEAYLQSETEGPVRQRQENMGTPGLSGHGDTNTVDSSVPDAGPFQTWFFRQADANFMAPLDDRERLDLFYKNSNPEKIGEVDALLASYSGKETEMFAALAVKYGKPIPTVRAVPSNPQILSEDSMVDTATKCDTDVLQVPSPPLPPSLPPSLRLTKKKRGENESAWIV
jgi:hypothetical protein